jgi:hypothetical protein
MAWNKVITSGSNAELNQIFATGGVTGSFTGSFVGKFPELNITKAITVESPTDSEDISLFFTPQDITVNEMVAVLRGTTPSVTWTIRHGSDRSATGDEVVTSGTTTTNSTTGDKITSFNDPTIPSGSFVWFETTAQSGTVDELNLTLIYNID